MMKKINGGVMGMVLCCGLAASAQAQVQQTNPSGLPVWTNLLDSSVPFKGGYSSRGTCPCVGPSTPENEADCGTPLDTVNGGCNSTPNVFSTIALGESVCGTAQIGTAAVRDTDWYRFTLTETTSVEFAVTAEFPVQLLILTDACPTTALAASAGNACVETTVRVPNLAAGSYIAFASPQQGSPFFACDTGSNAYQGTLRTYVPPPPPVNDNCAGAIDASMGGVFPVDTTSASNDAAGSCGASAASPDVWFKTTPTAAGDVTVSTCGTVNFDTVLAVYDACGGNEILCLDDFCGLQTQITFPVVVGPTYWIRVSGFNNATGSGTVSISAPTPPPPPPTNDDCSNALCFVGTSISSTTAAATPDCPGCCFEGPDHWFRYTPETSGTAVFNLCGSAYDTALSVFTDCGSAPLLCNDDSCGLQSRISFDVTAGTAVLIRVSGFAGSTGAYTLTLESGPAAASCAASCHGDCVADFDNGTFTGTPDGGVTIDDLLYYLSIFESGVVCADVDDGTSTGTPDGGVTIDDLLYYLSRFEAGC